MRRIAHVDLDQHIITNTSLAEDGEPLQPGTMLEADAIAQGFTRVNDPVEPEPDFDGMATALRTENGFKSAFLLAFSEDPMAAGSLTSRFDDFRKDGDFALFLQSTLLVLHALPPEQAAEIGTEFLAVASRCHMPPALLQALQALQAAFDAG